VSQEGGRHVLQVKGPRVASRRAGDGDRGRRDHQRGRGVRGECVRVRAGRVEVAGVDVDDEVGSG